MNKKAVVAKIAARTGIKKEAINLVLGALCATLVSELQKGEKINFSGFGKFQTRQRTGRKYVSFQTGETFIAPQRLVPVLKFSKNFVEKF